jgi:large subunit ribosomal protein L32
MAVPRHHMAKGKQLRRRSHLALKARSLTKCTHCSKMIMPHQVCKFCGFYKDREVLNIIAKQLAKRDKRAQAQK